MITLVPISRFRVPFATAQGRPYSHLEQLVCRSVGEGAATIDALVDTFMVHRRLITQAVVNLVQDGFVALGGATENALLLTREGAEAVERGALERTVVAPSRRTVVVMERLTGGLAPSAEVRFLDERQVREMYRDAPRIPIRVGYNELDGAQVRHLLPRRQFEWLQFIGTITQLSKGTHWLPVDADLVAGAVIGIPDRWDHRLSAIILEETRRVARALPEPVRSPPLPRQRRPIDSLSDDTETPRLPAEDHPVDLNPDDVLADSTALWDALIDALRVARSTVLVAVPTLTNAGVDRSADDLVAACGRGVRVELLWGRDAGGALARLKKLSYDYKLAGAIDFNQQPAPTAMSVVIADDGDGVMALIASSSALVDATDVNSATLAVRVRDAGIASALCLAAAGAWRAADGERLASGPDRLQRLAGELSAVRPPSQSTSGVRARVVLDRDHDVMVAHVLREARRRLVLVSAHPTTVAPTRLVELLSHPREPPFEMVVVVGAVTENEAVANQISGVLAAVKGRTYIRRGSSRGLVADDVVVVGSYDPLATEPYDASRGLRHVSIQLSGGEAANTVADLLTSA